MKSALILAAGLGTRLRPLTLTTPKPLVKVKGKALIDYALEQLEANGYSRVVVNVHYLAEQIIDHVQYYKSNMKIIISDETEALLDSGGGVVKALPLLGETFTVLNADTFWIDQGQNNLANLETLFTQENSDFAMLLALFNQSIGFTGKGDFHFQAHSRLKRRLAGENAQFIYAGAFITRKSAFKDEKPLPFSLNKLWDKAILDNSLHGLPLQGRWVHVGDVASLEEAERKL